MSSNPNRLQELIAVPYATLLVSNEHGFSARVVELGLVGRGATVAQAVAAMDAEKKRFFKRYIEAGEPGRLPSPTSPVETSPNGYLGRAAMISLVATGVTLAMLSAFVFLGTTAAFIVGSRVFEGLPARAKTYVARRQQEWESLTPEQRKWALACVSSIGSDTRLLTNALVFLFITPSCQSLPTPDASTRQ